MKRSNNETIAVDPRYSERQAKPAGLRDGSMDGLGSATTLDL